jgi:hypothetical protein
MILEEKDNISGRLDDIEKSIKEQPSKIIPLFDNDSKRTMGGDKPAC